MIRKRYQEFARGVRPIPLATDEGLSRRAQANQLLDAIEKIVAAG